MSPDGLGELQITDTPGEFEGPPDWSPDGGILTYDGDLSGLG